MSMLSAQCDDLRIKANIAELPLGVRLALRGAADTIWELRNKCADLMDEHLEHERVKAENAALREQMERLVTLLRNDCDIDASWDGLRRFWSIELTEDGCLMRDRACKAEAENAWLRAMRDTWAENDAKLRELVRDMWHELDAATQYDAGGGRGVVYEFADRMRELGMGVDADA